MITSKPKSRKVAAPAEPVTNGEVLTLAETARFLRVAEDQVVRLVQQQDLPGRLLDSEWRFLKSAIQDWLKSPPPSSAKEGIWAWAGAWKDDPHIDEILNEIYRKRGRPMSEEE